MQAYESNYTPPPTYGNYALAPAYAPPGDQRDLIKGCVCAIIFLVFVLVDAWKAMRRRAYWFPGGLLVLSALTIELIFFLDYSYVIDSYVIESDDLLKRQLVTDGGRLAICVFIAYLLPGMVSAGFRNVWSNIGALALSVILNMFLEDIILISQIHKKYSHSEFRWFELSSTILLASLILLVLLSICAVFAGKSIRYIMDQKVPLVLSCCDPNSPRKCENIEEHVLKCWIVVRSCQPDYIMARSVFSSLAGLVLTVCVVSITFKWVYMDHLPHKNLERLKHSSTFIIQFVFILVGWIVVSLRWLTAVMFFPRDGWCWIQMEDFWTRSIFEWKDGLDRHLKGRSFLKKRKVRNVMDLMIALRLHYLLLSICFCLQILMVFLSKASWFISQTLFWPLVTSRRNKLPAKFYKYKEALEIIRMPGEKAYSLWIANESAFKKTEKHFEQGRTSTRTSNKELLKLVKIGSAADETAETLMAEEKMYFKYVGKKSWKMRAVSLIRFMLCLYDGTNSEMVDDAIKACSQAWDLMDFVHISDREADVVSRRADIEFCTLHNIWKKHLHMKLAESKGVRRIRNKLNRDVQSKLSKIKESHVTVDKMHDSMNWAKAAVNISLYKTREAIGPSHTVDNIRRLLGNVIVNCLTKGLKKTVVEKCSKWAENGMEAEIYDAAFIAGKAFRLLEEIDGGNDGSCLMRQLCDKSCMENGGNFVINHIGGGNNHAVPQAVAEGEGNNGEAVADGEDNDASHSRDSSGSDNNIADQVVEAIVEVEEESVGEQPLLFF